MKGAAFVVALFLLAPPLHAQTAPDAAAPTAAKPGTLERVQALTGADAVIDHAKFEKVYRAGKAVASARFLSASGVSPRQFERLNLAFQTELDIVADTIRTKSKAEQLLFGQFSVAQAQFGLGLVLSESQDKFREGLEAMGKAFATLDIANKIYAATP